MKALRLVNAMNNIDDELIIEAAAETSERKKAGYLPKRIMAAAACIALLLCGTISVMAVATGFGTRIIEMYTARKEVTSDYIESGYVLSADVIKISEDSLSGNIKEISEIIVQQHNEKNLFSSDFPGLYIKSFSSALEAESFMELDVLQVTAWELDEQYTTLMALGNEAGEIMYLTLETYYQTDNMGIQMFSNIYTDKYTDDITYGTIFTEDTEFVESFYMTENEIKCQIIKTSVLEGGYMCTDGFLVKDGILYNINISHLKEDEFEAMALLCKWAEGF